ncbi:hypothetical protein LSM04_009143 [Trypanosoma melophagium]|uniref:uncharacterized protein n=1 Tax=Trypanosoma melophagium TaxID=715481 RepID=UPI00351A536B|nr:hypothetical protein LSM04_009143 [Trypanosoma melophagium]
MNSANGMEVSRLREQFAVRGRAPKPNSCTRDTVSGYGLFWFGKGKYEDDTLAEKDVQYQHQEQREQNNDISEADDIPDEERYKVWRPVEAPPRPRGWSRNVSLVPANEDEHPHLNNGNLFLSETTPGPKRKKTTLAPPWAEHYEVESNVLRSCENRAEKHHHDLFERGILPRGENGIDGILQYARNAQDLVLSLQELRMLEDRRQEQRMLKAALDEQPIDKRRRILAEYEKELVHIYVPTMQHILTDVFHQPLSEQPPMIEDASVDEEKEERENAHREKVPQRHFRQRVETPEICAKQSRQAWLAAWEEHKRNLASTSTANNTDAVANKWGRYHTVGTPSTPSIVQN